jgi:MSHA biogenesis protein MshL
MRENKKPYVLRIFLSLFWVVLLSGCQLSAEKRTARKEMQETLQEASNIDAKIAKNGANVPEGVRRAFLPAIVESQSEHPIALEKRFDLVADQVPAKLFFLSLVEDTPYNITVHPEVDGKISLKLKKVTVREVLDTVRNVYGFDYRQTAQGIEILPATLQTRAFVVNYLDLNRGGSSETQVSAGTLQSSTNQASTLANATSGATKSTESGSNTEGTANSRITTTSKADFWQELKTAVQTIVGTGEGRTVAVSPLASLLVVQAMPDELKKIEDFLKSAELSLNKQVILEAKILEVDLNDSFQAGINWALVSGRVNISQTGGHIAGTAPGTDDAFPVLNNSAPGPFNITPGSNNTTGNIPTAVQPFGGVFAISTNFKNLGTLIESLGAQGKIHVLSNPRVSTMNNQKALIKVGSDRFFITGISTTTTTSSSSSQTTPNVTFNPFFSGISLDVTPHITNKDEVTLHIHPTVSSVEDDIKSFTLNGEPQSYPLAKSSVRESDSIVKAKNGEMIVIGGLMKNQDSELKEGIPILKDLPLLGKLFQHTVQVTQKSELVILLRPIVVNDSTWSEQVDTNLDHFQKMNEELVRDENKFACQGADC